MHKKTCDNLPQVCICLSVQVSAFYNQIVSVGICAIYLTKGCFIIGMEEVFFAQRFDLVIDPIQQSGIALSNCRCYGINVSKCRNIYNIARIYAGL